MSECSSHETFNIHPNLNSVLLNTFPLNDQKKIRLYNINEIKD